MEENKTVLVIAPKEMTSIFTPSLERYGYEVKMINDPGSTPESWSKLNPPDLLVICDRNENTEFKWEECLPVLRKAFRDTHIVFAACSPEYVEGMQVTEVADTSSAKQKGADAMFFFPYEKELLLNEIFDKAPLDIPTSKLDLDAMMKVSLQDVNGETQFPFDVFVYLSLNKKVIMYRRAGADIEGSAKKLDDPRFHLVVRRGDYQKYQNQMISKLKTIQNSDSITPAQKAVLVKEEVRGLMGDLFSKNQLDPEHGKKIVENFRNVAFGYIDSMSEGESAQDRLKLLSAQVLSNHGHAMNVSSYAVMFAMMAGITDKESLESLSLAGMLHDVGFYKLPMNMADKKEWELSDSEREEYRMHPLYAIDVIAEKNLPAPAAVHKIIQQHHERSNGEGYPHGLEGEAIDGLSKILAMADVFDEMTSLEAGKSTRTPEQALSLIAGLSGDDPLPVYDEVVHKNIIEALLSDKPQVLDTAPLKSTPVKVAEDPKQDAGAIQKPKKKSVHGRIAIQGEGPGIAELKKMEEESNQVNDLLAELDSNKKDDKAS